MNERVNRLYNDLLKRDYRLNRSNIVIDYSKEFKENNLPLPLRASEQLYRVATQEKPLLNKDEKIGFNVVFISIFTLFCSRCWLYKL